MSLLQSVQIAHLPPSLVVHIALYRDVKNSPFLREQLISGNSAYEYAFIDASMILSTTHVLAAAFRAINDYENKRLKSRNVHSEIVFALSPNNNIADAFRRFGITDSTKDLLVVKVSTTPDITHESISKHLGEAIEGTQVAFDDATLSQITDISKIQKAYKLSNVVDQKPSKKPTVDAAEKTLKKRLETSIVGAIALRGS
ncbi:cgi121 [Nannizzia gypsea CBS 118893]|uniref:EKC/KEOPS complex subunit CGI121 n=1 Tax=Arthroderma gypseum (strain ATCC MYA-4604 / CBS 118893) TaxID=535722 RepID=E4UNV4_ARTGP|nr:cgi121 [Nannizzia gypsea CBS 118893]EFQ99707.1 cgi121 [Nannizzia gypsea CBS 118893]